MKDIKDIENDEIRIIGNKNRKTKERKKISIIFSIILVIVFIISFAFLWNRNDSESSKTSITEENIQTEVYNEIDTINIKEPGFIEIKDTVVNNIPLKIYIPYNAELVLHIGKMDLNDSSVIYAAQAADIRADNGGIVGAFVLKGEPRAWGRSKDGFCASIKGKITIGVEKNTLLFEKATEESGYFFRQYPLVHNGKVIQNKPKGKSIRRSLCNANGRIFMVESLIRTTFWNFSQSLVSLGVNESIYLVGSTSYGWAIDKNNIRHEFGDKSFYSEENPIPENINYIVWRRKISN